MSQDFIKHKEEFRLRIVRKTRDKILSENEKKWLDQLMEIFESYSNENKLRMKGVLTRVIIDSAELDSDIAELFIYFDGSIK